MSNNTFHVNIVDRSPSGITGKGYIVSAFTSPYQSHVASTIPLLQLITSAITAGSRAQKSVTNAIGDPARIIKELESLRVILESLDELDKQPADNNSNASATLLKELNVPLESCKATISRCLSSSDWLFEQQEVNDIVASLERTKASLQLCLAAVHR